MLAWAALPSEVVVARAVSQALQVPQASAELPLLAVSQQPEGQPELPAYQAPRPMALHPHQKVSQQLSQEV